MFKEYFISLSVTNKYAYQEKFHITLFFNLQKIIYIRAEALMYAHKTFHLFFI